MSQRVKKEDRLSVGLTIQIPDLNERASYSTPNRKMRIYIDNKEAGVFSTLEKVSIGTRIRSVIVAEKIFVRDNGDEEVDFVQKFIVGQNFIEATFNSGKVRRKPVSFNKANTLTLLQQQDFWK